MTIFKVYIYFLLLVLVFSCSRRPSEFTMFGDQAVSDKAAPEIILLGESLVTVAVGGTYIDVGATAVDSLDGDISESIVLGGDTVNVNMPGTYTLTYNVEDAAGNIAIQVVRTVNVIDDNSPVITLVGNSVENVENGGIYSDAGAVATDNLDGEISANIVLGGDVVNVNSLGIYVLTYDVADAAGNSAVQVIRTVNVVDTTRPVIAASNITIDLLNVNSWIDDVSAIDNIDGNITGSIVTTGDIVDQTVEGVYTLTYNVMDSSGNSAVAVVRTVTVIYCSTARKSYSPFANSQGVPLGNGTTVSYTICTLAQLQNVKNNRTSNFILRANIDASSVPDWEPIGSWGTSTSHFSGVFDGNGHKVSNITSSGGLMTGFFGYVNFGTIKNIGLENVNIVGSERSGGLVGFSSSGFVYNSYVTGSVRATGHSAGGLVAISGTGSIIRRSYSTADVTASYFVGGLVGSNYGIISNSYATGDVVATISSVGRVGGFVGNNNASATITNSYATGNISATSNTFSVGGFVGEGNFSSISNSFATGTVANCFSKCGGFSGDADIVGANNYRYFDHHQDSAYGGLVVDLEDFYDSSQVPFISNWNFVTTWEERSNEFPTLLNMPN